MQELQSIENHEVGDNFANLERIHNMQKLIEDIQKELSLTQELINEKKDRKKKHKRKKLL